ncbi:Acetophenone carboxylase gamma subunit [bacterium HR26]|nr:Acetophenone carboxylase gamma subunit [bacterium HR26]
MGIRVGIDVGGTFTKAVAIESVSGALVGKVTVPTTHHAAEGVARGLVEAFRSLLQRTGIDVESIELIVLSTTQAVNALLEGDVAPVGVVGIGQQANRKEAFRRTRIDAVQLTPERRLPVFHAFLDAEELSEARVADALRTLMARGARAIAVSAAYGVEDPTPERAVLDVATSLGLPATAGHEMSGLYGLEVRTLTAAVNASILPRMAETTRWVEQSLAASGLQVPLMIMHGDLAVSPLEEARRLAASTILSGPAASVAGALLYHKLLDGLFMEVGGTSTNVGVIRHGRPVMKYVRIMDHPTCLRSVDVRVAGVAGGSLVRLRGRKIAGAGPRSAHVAGLPYPCFTSPEMLSNLRLVTLAPRPGDPEDYAALEDDEGRRYAITLTDAANALGLVPEGDYARGYQESARRALAPLAERLGMPVERAARLILDEAAKEVEPLLRDLVREYRLRRPVLLGLGGGAAVLVPVLADRLGVDYQIVPHAEVISSIGVALAPISVEVERSFSPGQPARLLEWVRELEQVAVRYGADPKTVQVTVEPIPERAAVRLRAAGTCRGTAGSRLGKVDLATARSLAAQALRVRPEALTLVFDNGFYRVFQTETGRTFGPFRRRRRLAVIDREGAVRFVADDGTYVSGEAQELEQKLRELSDSQSRWYAVRPNVLIVQGPRCLNLPHWGPHLFDLSQLGLDGAVREPIAVLAGMSLVRR